MPDIRILPLQQRPQVLDDIAQWHFNEWQALYPQDSLQDFRTDLASTMSGDILPSTWLLLVDDEVVATASLLRHDLSSYPQLSPWLANVFVLPQWRGRGLAKRLIRQVMANAWQAGVAKLYLFTEDQTALYQSLGWCLWQEDQHQGKAISVMTAEPG